MDFFARQDTARRHTKWLVVYFVIAVALMIVWMILAATQKHPSGSGAHLTSVTTAGADPALAIVRSRYQRGEIDRAEYERLVTGLLFRT